MDSPEPPPNPEAVLGCLALVQVAEDAALRSRVPAALARGEEILQRRLIQAVEQVGGELVQAAVRGWAGWFVDPLAAVTYALRLQADLLREDWPATLLVRPEAAEEHAGDGTLLYRGLRVRIGIHRGRVLRSGSRLRGPALVQLARITGAAHGGQVVLSEAAWRKLRGALPGTVVLRDLGGHRLTGVGGSRRLFQVLTSELDRRSPFPEPLAEDVRRTNVPPHDDFVGRQPDVAALLELTSLGVRLVTVLGVEGVGRSRLCRQLALVRRGDERLVGGVWLAVPLERSAAGLIRAAAEALSVGLADAASEREAGVRIGHALASRGRALLVIDGLAAEDPAVVPLVETWLTLATELTIVVAASERLRTRGEVAYELGPLSLPLGPDGARHADAVRMYAARARAIDPRFQLGSGEEVAELVRALAGHPLSIRLMAGVVDRLPLIDQLEALANRTSPGEVLSVAWDALSDTEREVLAVCACHAGSFEAVDPPPGLEEVDVHAQLATLARRGWVRASPDPAAPDVYRYAVAPEVASFVARHLPPGRLDELRAHRAAAVLRECAPWTRAARLRDRPEVVAHLALEWPNLVQVIAEGVAPDRGPDDLDVAVQGLLALGPVLLARGPLFEGIALADAVLRRCDEVLEADPLSQVRALALRATLLVAAGRASAALQDLDRAEGIAERWSDVEGRAECLLQRGRALFGTGAPEPAIRALEGSAASFADASDPIGEGRALAWLGAVEMGVGRYDEAEGHLQLAIATLRAQDARAEEARALNRLALLCRRNGRFDEARALYREVIRILSEEGATSEESLARSELALLDYHLDRPAEADAGLEEAAALARRIGDRRAEAQATGHGGLVALTMGDPQVARERLLRALAMHRDLADAQGEGRDTGMLGILHHLQGQPEAAREFYRRALELLDNAGDRRLEALYSAWLAALEAEAGDAVAARALYDIAMIKHAESADPQVGEALLQLRGAVDWVEAQHAEASGAMDEAARYRRAARDRLDIAEARRAPLPGEARLALKRVAQLIRGEIRDADV